MASFNRVVFSGSSDTISVPFPYIDKSHVQVRVADVLLSPNAYTWPSAGQVKITGGPPTIGTLGEVRRVTPTIPIVVFNPGNLDVSDLNVADLQGIYLAEEALNTAADVVDRGFVSPDDLPQYTPRPIIVNYPVTASDRNKIIVIKTYNCVVSLPDAAAVGPNFYFTLKGGLDGAKIVVNPVTGQLIEGMLAFGFYGVQSALIASDGVGWNIIYVWNGFKREHKVGNAATLDDFWFTLGDRNTVPSEVSAGTGADNILGLSTNLRQAGLTGGTVVIGGGAPASLGAPSHAGNTLDLQAKYYGEDGSGDHDLNWYFVAVPTNVSPVAAASNGPPGYMRVYCSWDYPTPQLVECLKLYQDGSLGLHDGSVATKGAISYDQNNGDLTVGDAVFANKLHTTQWLTYTPTFTGFSVNPTVKATWTRVGRLIVVKVDVIANGTSNGTGYTMTAPTPSVAGSATVKTPVALADGGVAAAAWGMAVLAANSNVITLYKDAAASPWTATGAKGGSFTMSYEAAGF